MRLRWDVELITGDRRTGIEESMLEAVKGTQMISAGLRHDGYCGRCLSLTVTGMCWVLGNYGFERYKVSLRNCIAVKSRIAHVVDARQIIGGEHEVTAQSLVLEHTIPQRVIRIGWRINLKNMQVEPLYHDDEKEHIIVERVF